MNEYNADLLAKMRIQLHLSGKELDDLIRCPLSGEDYAKLLIERGILEKKLKNEWDGHFTFL